MLVDLDQICAPVWPRPDPRSRLRGFLTSENYTFLGLSPQPFWRVVQKWWLMMIVWDLLYSLIGPIFEFPSKKAITWVQTSQNADITRTSNCHISILLEDRVTQFGMLIVLHVLCMMIWPWLDPRSRSRSRGLLKFQQVFSSSWGRRPFGHNRHGPKIEGGGCAPFGEGSRVHI